MNGCIIADVLDTVIWATYIQTNAERAQWEATYNASIDLGLFANGGWKLTRRPDIGQPDPLISGVVSYYMATTVVNPPSPM
jgi:hypothetical protein